MLFTRRDRKVKLIWSKIFSLWLLLIKWKVIKHKNKGRPWFHHTETKKRGGTIEEIKFSDERLVVDPGTGPKAPSACPMPPSCHLDLLNPWSCEVGFLEQRALSGSRSGRAGGLAKCGTPSPRERPPVRYPARGHVIYPNTTASQKPLFHKHADCKLRILVTTISSKRPAD